VSRREGQVSEAGVIEMPTTISGTTIVTTAITGSSIRLTGGTQGLITPTTGSAPYYGVRAWAAVSSANTTPVFVGYNISSVALVSTGQWDVTFTTAGYANVNSICVLTTFDTNYTISMGYWPGNSNTSKIRLSCIINNGTAYSVGSFSVACFW
jgi:hypothetical protein